MASAATSKAKEILTEQEAIQLLNSLPRLVAAANQAFLVGSVVEVEYDVESCGRKFTFPMQRFRIIRRLSREEYNKSLPVGMCRAGTSRLAFYYEIFTD